MSKKLDSILKQVPHATVQEEKETNTNQSTIENAEIINRFEEPTERIVAVIPRSLKKQIKLYLVDNPHDTEKTVILRGLKKIGFNIADEYLIDKRGKR